MRRWAAATLMGCTRSSNDDRTLVAAELGLYAVSDGMGGLAGGRRTAELVVAALPDLVGRHAAPGVAIDDRLAWRIGTEIARLSDRLRNAAASDEPRGATVVMCLVRADRMLVAHLGDSRAYLFRAGHLTALTDDHSVAAELVAAGRLDRDLVPHHAGRAALTRFIAMPTTPVVDVTLHSLLPSDRVVLCSDGMLDVFDDGEFATLLDTADDPADVVGTIIATATAKSAPDDVAVVVVNHERDNG